MKIKITESQFNYLLSEQLTRPTLTGPTLTGPTMNVSSGTYAGTTSNQQNTQFQSPEQIKKQKIKNDKIALAQKTWNTQELNKAINWWKKWLEDPNTKNRFSTNWKYPSWMTDSIFELYNNALNGLTLKYVYDPKELGIAWVAQKYPKIVTINAAQIKNNAPVDTFVHELQHLLFFVKPLHPSQNINKDLNIDLNSNTNIYDELLGALDSKAPTLQKTNNKSSQSTQEPYEKKMKELGLSEKDKSYFREAINDLTSEKKQYIAGGHSLNGQEIMSRLESLRYKLGKKSGQPITPTEIGKLGRSDTNAYWAILSIILSENDTNYIINQWNQYVRNNPNPKVSNQNTMA